MAPQGSHPASRELQSHVPVETFLNRGHLDVEASFSRSSALSRSLGCLAWLTTIAPSISWSGGSPIHAVQPLTSPISLSAMCPGVPSVLSPASPGFTNVYLATAACMGCSTPLWTASQLAKGALPWSALTLYHSLCTYILTK